MADEHQISPEILKALIEGGANGKPQGPPFNPKKFADNAVASLALYLEERAPFSTGDVIRQRIGLCLLPREAAVVPYVFYKYLPDDERMFLKFPEHHNVDCIIGQSDPDGDIHFTVTDSRRYELYPQDAMDELTAKAILAVN